MHPSVKPEAAGANIVYLRTPQNMMVPQQDMMQTQQPQQPQQFHPQQGRPIYHPPYATENEPPYEGLPFLAPHPYYGMPELFAWSPSQEKTRCLICRCWVEASH